ncbi:hypothetical protein SPRG_22028 [Saprolegnia parasitica CBS 223.65]|uniref:Uncharacterized protein n=1 Tax=Saprolegnia parasitica (strain CBS 223.65) TaxID=695850 RepID=A0A067BMP3_SAPPC|nr:hypothetical protein SPRG_22028 [Saprolegnia parasitica CBS 223.65]KDO16002.1 hypothetical protein SPRG_22028 [Saprolegnia parasitica CBS 223.65]|eukprot:XP_012213290.1 hypothetical protein SPRG_22028 [Saprolegnia parasitica CBS 223.65]
MPHFEPVLTTRQAVPYRIKLRSKAWHASVASSVPGHKKPHRPNQSSSALTILPKIHHRS